MHTRIGPIQVVPFAVKSDIAFPCHDKLTLRLVPWSEQFPTLIQSHSPLSGHASIVVTCLRTSEQMLTDTRISTCLGIFHSASDTARHRFWYIENTRLDPASSFPAVPKSGNRVNYCGRNSSELSCMSSAAGNQSIVPALSESPQLCCKEGARRLVDIYLPLREGKSFTHSVIRTVHEPE